jgi:hypothetical protein
MQRTRAIDYAISLTKNQRPSELAHLLGYKLQRINWWKINDIPNGEIYKVAKVLTLNNSKGIIVEPRVLHTMKFEAKIHKGE